MSARATIARQRRAAPGMASSMTAQILEHNDARATRCDDKFVIPGQRREKVHGQGRWQQMLPRTFLRIAFAHPSAADKALAKQHEVSHSSVGDVRSTAADLLLQGQKRECTRIMTEIHTKPFGVFQFMWDNTTFRLQCAGEKGKSQPIMAFHGLLTWPEGDQLRNEEVIFPPSVLWDETADAMLGAMQARSPVPVGFGARAVTGIGDCLLGMAPGCDGAKANDRLLNHVENTTEARK